MLSCILCNDKRYFSILSQHFKNYYEALGVTPKATQADIKAAYYKLSMLYHPDRNKGSQSASEKFQIITAAYEVLGQYKSRKLYDRGILQDTVIVDNTAKQSAPIFHKERSVSTGRTPIYNFDEWSRAHYGHSFARRNTAKKDFQTNVNVTQKSEKAIRNENVIFSAAMFILVFCIIKLTYSGLIDADIPPASVNIKENDGK